MTGALTPTRAGAGAIVVDRCGPHALIRCQHESGRNRLVEAALPRNRGHLALLVSGAAHRHPALETTIHAVLRSAAADVHTVWLGLVGLGVDRGGGAPLVRRILNEFGIDVVAPDGWLAGAPDTGGYVGPSTGSVGWRRFHASRVPTVVVTNRFPIPVWERALPLYPTVVAGVRVDPVLAGLLARQAPAPALTPDHPAFLVPADPQAPKLLLASDQIGPGQVADVLNALGPATRAIIRPVPLGSALGARPAGALVATAAAAAAAPPPPVATMAGPGIAPAKPAAPAESTVEAAAAKAQRSEPVVEATAESEPLVAAEEADADVVRAGVEPWPERRSTVAEQGRFTTAAGGLFTDGLSLVNSALATWPALRRADAGAKADYVAVCLYLTRGAAGAVALNRALRAGREPPVDGHPACLVSGLARLPVHRRVVLRQARLDGRFAVGAVLTEPGFLSASVGADLTVAGAEADLLIWPRSARRAAELVLDRPMDEAVFPPGRRFTVLAVRTAGQDGAAEGDEDQPSAPPTAVLLRELAPNESDVDRLDAAALTRLDRAWRHRQRIEPRPITDPDLVARLLLPMAVTP